MGARCRYCTIPIRSKSGIWGRGCAGCKGTLTRWLRSGKYTKAQLLGATYSWETEKWTVLEEAQ